MTIAILGFLLFLLIFSAVPITWALGFTGLIGLIMVGGNPMTLIPQSIYNGVSFFPLLAIPFYIMAGEMMCRGGITRRLVNLSSLIIGRVPGSLAQVNILCSMFFGGITGSAVADTSSVGAMLIPAMVEEGYSREESVAVTVTSSIMGPIIPPSIIMVLYGSAMKVSIGSLFAGGAIPGILVGLALSGVVIIRNRKHHFPVRKQVYSNEQNKKIIKEAIAPLMLPIIIMGGILSGIFTATEAGCIALIYTIIVSMFVLKKIKIYQIPEIILSTMKTTSTILIIVGCSKTLSWALALLQIQNSVKELFLSNIHSSFVFLLIVNLLYLFLGTLMDPAAALLLFAPLLGPIALGYGIDPIHFGLITCINLNIGNATPPLGQCLFVGCKIGKIQLLKVSVAVLPYLIALIAVLLLVTYIPAISLFLPSKL